MNEIPDRFPYPFTFHALIPGFIPKSVNFRFSLFPHFIFAPSIGRKPLGSKSLRRMLPAKALSGDAAEKGITECLIIKFKTDEYVKIHRKDKTHLPDAERD